jgi:hypothetical protein
MPEPKRVSRSGALDEVSDHLAEVLRRADELLAEWSRFGAGVREQVDREATNVGRAVATAVDGAVARATSTGVERAIADQIGVQLTALATEIGRLETRARAAQRAVGEERRADRRVLWGVVGGVLIANALLVVMLLRKPTQLPPPAPEPARVEVPVAAPSDAAVAEQAIDAALEAPAPPADGSAAKPAAGSATKPTATKPKPATLGAPAGLKSVEILDGGSGSRALAVPPPHPIPRRK